MHVANGHSFAHNPNCRKIGRRTQKRPIKTLTAKLRPEFRGKFLEKSDKIMLNILL